MRGWKAGVFFGEVVGRAVCLQGRAHIHEDEGKERSLVVGTWASDHHVCVDVTVRGGSRSRSL